MPNNNQIEIIVELIENAEEKGNFSLKFNFYEPINLSLTSASSSDLKDFFVHLMNKMMVCQFVLKFPSVETDIYSNMSRSYITHLNSELSTIFDEIPVVD